MRLRTVLFLVLAGLGAVLGLIYSGFSTADFVAHLDRQLHPVNCSFLPGLEEAKQLDAEASGCKVAMFSPYSSFWRERYWGGIPWSLFAVGLYGFALALVVWMLASRKGHRLVPTTWLSLTALTAVGASVVFFSISVSKLDTFCTLCVGTYISSGVLLLGAALTALSAWSDRKVQREANPEADPSVLAQVIGFCVLGLELLAAVLAPPYAYATALPDYQPYVSSCGELKVADENGFLFPLGPQGQGAPAVMVLDPLCAACKAFHGRLVETGYAARLSTKVQLLPLDAECNWMIKDSMHPGACLLSKALLCSNETFDTVLAWIFEHQESFRLAGMGKQVDQIEKALFEQFPGLQKCVKSPETSIRLNKVLRHAVSNSLPLLTPQLYIQNRRLCDEDTDLGLDYAMKLLLNGGAR
jgi:uncharacterized membrane protein